MDFLRYQDEGHTGFWVTPLDDVPGGLSISGDMLDNRDESENLPVLCRHTAPFLE